MRERQVDGTSGSPRLPLDRARHPVAGRQIAGRIRALHERLARVVDEPGAFATKRLGQQEPRLPGHLERRRMKLHELEIAHRRASPIRHGDTVAGRDERIRGLAVDVPGAAGREQHGPRPRDTRRPVLANHPNARAAAVVDDQVHRACVIDGLHAGHARRLEPEDATDLTSGGISRVKYAARAVRAFDRQRELPIRARSNSAPHAMSSRTYPGPSSTRTRTARSSHRPSPAAIVSAGVQVGRVSGSQRCGDAALRVAGVPFLRIGLGQDEDPGGVSELHRRAKARDPAADDEEIGVKVHVVSDPVILPFDTSPL